MKKLFIIIIFFISFQILAKADDIRDFEIEGISIGDSLLDFMSAKEIKSSKLNYVEDDKKYYVVGYYKNLKIYDAIEIYLKRNDSKYIIRTVSGMIAIKKKDCLKKKEEIVYELRQVFSNATEKSYDDISHSFDKTGDTKLYQTGFLLKKNNNDDHIRVECTDWSKKFEKENNFEDNLSISAFTREILLWFGAGYN